MASYTVSANEIVSQSVVVNDAKAPVDVQRFVQTFSGILNSEYLDGATGRYTKDGQEYLKGLYNLVVFNGKTFKDQIPRCGSNKDRLKPVNPNVPSWVDCGTEILTHKKNLLAFIIRGSSDTSNIRSEIHKLPSEHVVLVMTYRLFQAVISIMIAKCGFQKTLLPAKLFANVNLSCKIEAASISNCNWAIHGHSGINFVANYVKKITPPATDEMKKLVGRLPTVENLLMMAFRMDQSQRDYILKSHSKILYPTVEAIFRSTGITALECDKLLESLQESSEKWGDSYVSRSNSVTTHFVNSMTAIASGKSKPSASSSRLSTIDEGTDTFIA